MTSPAADRPALLWRVGDVELGPDQFAASAFTTGGTSSCVFVIGRDDPAVSWPSFQPSPLDGSSGFRDHTVTVEFELAEAPGETTLQLVLNATHGPCPQLLVEANGRRGLFFPQPVRDDRSRKVGPPSMISGWATVEAALPAQALVVGTNRISISTTLERRPPVAELRRPQPFFGNWFGSGITWGELSLRVGHPAQPTSLEVNPTPLFVRGDAGLCEIADCLVTSTEGGTGDLLLDIGGIEVKADIDFADREFGQCLVRLHVPEVGSAVPLTGRASVGSQAATVEGTFRPCRQWTVHLLPHVHLDIGYTDHQGKVIELHSRNLDRALEILRTTPDYRFTVDGSFIIEEYLDSRTQAAGAEVLDAVRAGSLGVNAFYLLFLTGVASLEECYRGVYYSAHLRDEAGVRLDYANLTDVPSYSASIPGILRSLGVDAFLGIQNHGRAATVDSDTLHLQSPMRWQGLDGQDVLTFFSDGYSQLRFMFADPPTTVGMENSLTRLLARYERQDYLPSDLPVVGVNADNEDLAQGESDLVERWNSQYAYPRLRFSTIGDYFQSVRPLRDQLPVHRGDGGSFWEDGVGTHATAQATYRHAQVALPQAEAVSALVTTVDPRLQPARAALDKGWRALLFGSEHTWTASHATLQPESDHTLGQTRWKVRQIDQAQQVALDETRRAMSQLTELVTTDGPCVVIMNTLSWPRRSEVRVQLQAGVGVVDAEGVLLPHEVIDSRDGLDTVRLLAAEIPAFGYRCYRIAPGARALISALPDAPGASLETQRYRLTVDESSGRITSLWSSTLARELIDPEAGYSLGEVLYVTGGGTAEGRGVGAEATTLYDLAYHLPEPVLDVTSVPMRWVGSRRTPWGAVVTLAGAGPTLPRVQVELHLRDYTDRVDLVVRLEKEATLAKESVYVAFPFATGDQPRLRYARQVGWVDPVADHLVGACNEWFTTLDAVTVDGAAGAITWTSAHAPLFCSGDVVRGRWSRRASISNGTILSWVMNNYWWTNTPASQSGSVELSYSFTPSNAADPAADWRTGVEARTPPAVSDLTWLDKADTRDRPLPAHVGSLLPVELPDTVVARLHPARDGRGAIVRLQELAGREVRITLPHSGRANACTALEDDVRDLAVDSQTVQVTLAPLEVATVRLW